MHPLHWSAVFFFSAFSVGVSAQTIPLTPIASASGAAVTENYGIEFSTVGSPGNQPYTGVPGPVGEANGHGSVPYEYRIARFETTRAQWAEFLEAAVNRPVDDPIPFVGYSPTYSPGHRIFTVPASIAMQPQTSITWRQAAIYCNWLSNDRRTDRAAFMSGAYEVSTFGYRGNIFTDQLAHSPGARFWIPTFDEWVKAAHYDPNRYGPGQGGYWRWSISSDDQPLYGLPGWYNGGAQAAAGLSFIQYPSISQVPVGSFPTVQSPWGLLDTAGGEMEWTEGVTTGSFGVRWRTLEGTWLRSGSVSGDTVGSEGGDGFPSEGFNEYGLRIASAVPAPNAAVFALFSALVTTHRRRRVE